MEKSRIDKNSSVQAIDYQVYILCKKDWCTYGLMALGLDAIFSYIFYKSVWAFMFGIPLCVVFPLYMRRLLNLERKAVLTLEFKEAILIVSSLVSAGYSLENALKESIKELELLYPKDALIIREFTYLYHLVYMNISVEKAFEDLAIRSGVEEIKSFSNVLRISKRSGGGIVDIISQCVSVISDKVRIKEEIRTLTAAKRFEQKVMNAFPILIVLYIDMSSPTFFELMYTTIIGRIFMTGCLLIYIFAMYLSNKLLRVEV